MVESTKKNPDSLAVLMRCQVKPKAYVSKPSCVIIGKTGVGKTTIVNKICQTEFEAKKGSNSVTRNLKVGKVVMGNADFDLIDSPGLDSKEDAFQHIYLLHTALTCRPHNTIFVVVEFNSRFEKLVEQFIEIETAMGEYIDKIVIVISKWDQADDKISLYTEICKEFEDYKNNILFVSREASGDEIAKSMYAVCSNMDKSSLKLTETEFMSNFNLASMKINMQKELCLFKNRANEQIEMYKEAVINRPNENNRESDEFLHLLLVEFKNDCDLIYEEFCQKFKSLMDELNHYAFAITLQNTLLQCNDTLKSLITPLMSYDIFDRSDLNNWFKRCPACGLIWMKIDACPNTVCGNRDWPTTFDILSKPFWKFVLKKINGKLQWTKSEKPPLKIEGNNLVKDNGEQITSKTIGYNKKSIVNNFEIKINDKGYVGCGATMNFQELPPVEKEIIDQMFKVKSKDVIYKMMENEKFQENTEIQKKSIMETSVPDELKKK
jgi:small GTP-binding protein